MKRFIINGGNFINTGAEAMTCITITELKKRYPDCEIYMISNSDFVYQDKLNLKVEIIKFDNTTYRYLKTPVSCIITTVIRFLKDIISKKNELLHIKRFKHILMQCNCIIDISGYALSSQWGIEPSNRYLNFLETVHKYNIPCYIMPQSIGPFDYGEETERLKIRIKEIMSKCKLIYAREKDGYKLLHDDMRIENVRLSCDIVFQNQEIVKDYIFTKHLKKEVSYIKTNNNVAVIPNMRNFDHGNKEQLVKIYNDIIAHLLSLDKNVYLLSHSKEDAEACVLFKKQYVENENVILLTERFDCFSYSEVVRNFDYIIASRYHSIVHAYKECVPSIAIGWATKYQEVMSIFGLSDYVFDVRNLAEADDIIFKINEMNKVCFATGRRIKDVLIDLQKNNCFDNIDI